VATVDPRGRAVQSAHRLVGLHAADLGAGERVRLSRDEGRDLTLPVR